MSKIADISEPANELERLIRTCRSLDRSSSSSATAGAPRT